MVNSPRYQAKGNATKLSIKIISHGKSGSLWRRFSLPCPQVNSECVQFQSVEFLLPIFLLLVPVFLKTVNGADLPHVRTKDKGNSSWLNSSLPMVEVHTFSFRPYLGAQVLITFLPFILDYVCIFLTVLVLQESFCQYYIHNIT